MEFSSLIGWCILDEFILFFLSPAKKEERNPTHIAAHLQAPRANAQNQSLQKSCNRPKEAHEHL